MTMTEDAPTDVSAPTAAAQAAPADTGGKKEKKGKKDKGGKGKSNLVPAVVLALGLAAGGYFMGGSGGSGEATAAEADADAEPVAPEPGEVTVLEPITVNLADDRFLRVGVAILTTSEFESHGAAHGDGEPTFSSEYSSRLRDQLIAMFGGRDAASLVGPEQLEDAKGELLDRANSVLDDHALEVYFTEFVMQ